ncbi:hypothetical protein [Balneola vulgaris]|jgi:hypothetical protein|uniref:hypothetical protein n=1 Tax=Balneola vulgaris TaxID=287535 RepID=UPI0003AADA58|nr:hypothetical protein [Balneola vulgaris]
MKDKNRLLSIVFGISLLSIVFVPRNIVFAQNSKVSVEIDVSDVLQNAQLIGLTNLGLDSEGKGANLITGYLQNLTPETLENLFFEVSVTAGKVGEIVKVNTQPGFPFSLAPMQAIYVTNNTLSEDGVPGIKETVKFEGGLTAQGDNFIENLDGATTLPADVYTIQVTVFQVTNSEGRVDLASTSAEIGGSGPIAEEKDIFLKTPGDVIDANIEITNPFPQFSWDAEAGLDYRLLVVKSNGQDSPESLIESAKSSAAITKGGSLLQFENLDVIVNGDTYQYPSSGAQPLEAGQTYYWQLSTDVQAGIDTETRTSEIWSFKLSEPSNSEPVVVISEEIKNVITRLIGNEKFQNLVASGFTLQSITVDGVTYTGPQASLILDELKRKIEADDIVIGGN